MAPPTRFGRMSLVSIFLLFLSLLNLAGAAALPEDGAKQKRGQTPITQAQYEAYLKKYFPATDKYLQYSGESEDQLKAFQAKNPGYYGYDDLFNAPNTNHPWYKAFDEATQIDDGEASSRAMSAVATKQILVFGAIEYMTAGKDSYYTLQEAPINKAGIKAGRLSTINHMAKGATSLSQVMAKEDGDGKITWQSGYKAGTKNASKAYCGVTIIKRAAKGACDQPVITPKTGGACSIKKRAGTTSDAEDAGAACSRPTSSASASSTKSDNATASASASASKTTAESETTSAHAKTTAAATTTKAATTTEVATTTKAATTKPAATCKPGKKGCK